MPSRSLVALARTALRQPCQSHGRSFGTTRLALEPKKPSIKSISELRKLIPGTSMIKAREALLASRSSSSPDDDDVPAALRWLDEDRKKSGAKKAEKVAGRSVREGVVAVSVLADGLPTPLEASDKSQLKHEAVMAGIGATSGAQGALVEVNCETDFVARNEVFAQLLRDIAHTAALFPSLAASAESGSTKAEPSLVDIPVQDLLAFPLLPSSPEAAAATTTSAPRTVGSAIIDTVSRLGERISIARACAIQGPAVPSASAPRRSDTGKSEGSSILHLASAFAHGGSSSAGTAAGKAHTAPGYVLTTGQVASLLLTRVASPALPDALAASTQAAPPTLQDSTRALVRSLARQTAGMNTKSIRDEASAASADEPSESLYSQPFMMLLPTAAPSAESSAQPVQQVLMEWAIAKSLGEGEAEGVVEVVGMKRWEMGETAEPEEEKGEGFAKEVKRAAGLA